MILVKTGVGKVTNNNERHAIAIGKALKLKQPVIIQLNNMKYHKHISTDELKQDSICEVNVTKEVLIDSIE